MRTIGVVTVARSDFGINRPVMKRIRARKGLGLAVYAAGMHLSPEFDLTVKEIEKEGFHVDERVEMLLSSGSPEGLAKSLGVGILGFAQVFARSRPDVLLLLGDRFEMLAAAAAALPFALPMAHIHGGESTEGAIDEAVRHSLTKMSHIHFASTEAYARRIIGMGEEPWRVTVSGAPGLDNLLSVRPMPVRELESAVGMKLDPAPLLVTYHSVTLEYEDTGRQVRNLLAALDEIDLPVIFTSSNADTGHDLIAQAVKTFVRGREKARFIANLGTRAYFSLMRHVGAMVGNSSSGIIEAASFQLPVVNVGRRQQGRMRAANVLDVSYEKAEIVRGIGRALSRSFRDSLKGLRNPYGDGRAAERIVDVLKNVSLDARLLRKSFYDRGREFPSPISEEDRKI